jgi:hypothetical protein
MSFLLKQSNPVKPATKITWMDTVLTYRYVYTESTQVLGEKMAVRELEKSAHSKSSRTSKIRCVANAIINVLKRKHIKHKIQFRSLLPDLAKFNWSTLSLDEMETKAAEIIDKLDSLRPVDSEDCEFSPSNEYRMLEKRLSLLLDAHECVYHIKCVESLLSNIQQHGQDKDASSDIRPDVWASMRYLFPFKRCAVDSGDD